MGRRQGICANPECPNAGQTAYLYSKDDICRFCYDRNRPKANSDPHNMSPAERKTLQRIANGWAKIQEGMTDVNASRPEMSFVLKFLAHRNPWLEMGDETRFDELRERVKYEEEERTVLGVKKHADGEDGQIQKRQATGSPGKVRVECWT